MPLSWIALLSLTVGCADDAPANATATALTSSATGSSGDGPATGSTGASAATTGDESTSPTGTTTSASPTSTSATATSLTDGSSTDEGETGTPGETSDTGDADTDPVDTDTDTDTDADEPLLPGCGPTPPEDFEAQPSAPAGGATVPGPAVSLEVTIGGEILDEATADFHVREVHTLTDADDFTIVILPDTQNYTQFPGNYPQYQAQTKWVWDHRNSDRIVAVLHNGDVVQHGNQIEVEWERADKAMKTIETETEKFLDGIPYGIAVGNHDNGSSSHDNIPFSTHFFNKYFGVSRFKGRAYYGGHYGDKNDNSWIVVRAGNLDVVMVSLEYRGDLGQDPKVLAWAKGVLEEHPHALGIVNSHHIVKANGDFSGEGKQIYAVMKTVDNVQLMTSGHIKEIRARRTDDHKGHKIHSMLADYQDLIIKAEGCAGGCGYLRIWRFSPKKNQLKVETYSPVLDKFMTGAQEEFTLNVDLSAATGVFAKSGSTSGPGETLAYTLEGVKAGATYEWYAVVKQCGAKVTTPRRQFTVN